MATKAFTALVCSFAIVGQMRAQEVMVPRETQPNASEPATPASKLSDSESESTPAKKTPDRKKKSALPTVEQMRTAGALAAERLKNQARVEKTNASPAPKPEVAKVQPVAGESPRKEKPIEQSSVPHESKSGTKKSDAVGRIEPVRPTIMGSGKQETDTSHSTKDEPRSGQTHAPQSTNGSQLLNKSAREQDVISAQSISLRTETAFTKLADGFDFPVGIPDGQGYYKARGFRPQGHLGEDWDGIRGGDTDLGDPVHSIGTGIVVFARDCHMGWGNVIIVRHACRDDGIVKNIDSLYGHLDSILVRRGQVVARGQKIGAVGTAHGLYDAHLHLEIRKNIEIGMSRASFARDLSNYCDPSQFILTHRHLQTSPRKYRIAMNTFTRDILINWDNAPDYSHYHGGTSESAAALKKALALEH
jgi:murein DD-endopeptidase MepM/ murein hydrolase activator NlpD